MQISIFQINVDLKPNENLTVMADVKPVLFPLLWADENAELDDENAQL